MKILNICVILPHNLATFPIKMNFMNGGNDTDRSSTGYSTDSMITVVGKVDHLARDFEVIGLNSNTGQSPVKPVIDNNNGETDADMKEEPLEKATTEQAAVANEENMNESPMQPSLESSLNPSIEPSMNSAMAPPMESSSVLSSTEPKGTALEELAKNLEIIGDKYRSLDDTIKDFDMIAFKVLVPPCEKSNYVIGMVEDINRISDKDFYLTLLIMGEYQAIDYFSWV